MRWSICIVRGGDRAASGQWLMLLMTRPGGSGRIAITNMPILEVMEWTCVVEDGSISWSGIFLGYDYEGVFHLVQTTLGGGRSICGGHSCCIIHTRHAHYRQGISYTLICQLIRIHALRDVAYLLITAHLGMIWHCYAVATPSLRCHYIYSKCKFINCLYVLLCCSICTFLCILYALLLHVCYAFETLSLYVVDW